MKKVEIEIVKAQELDPNKRYFIELDAYAYTKEDAQHLRDGLYEMGVQVAVAVNYNGKVTTINELPQGTIES